MLLAQITDTHVRAGRRLAYRRVDTAGLLEAAVAHVNGLRPAVDAVIVSGDLVDFGRAEEYAVARPILERLAMPWYVIPGNHDDRAALAAAFPDHVRLRPGDAFVQYAVDDHPLRLVGLDTTEPGQPHGFLCDARLAWLDATLAAAPDRPTLLFMHHPPFDTGIRHMDVQRLRNPEDLFAVLAGHPQVRQVACGHVHRAVETTIAGIGVSIGPNAAHAVALDLDPEGPPAFTMEPPALRLFRMAADGTVTAHLSYLGRFDGPHPFYDATGALID